MGAVANKHYKFINSKTGYVIYYHSVSSAMTPDEIKAELEKVKAQVAINNSLFSDTIYFEEIKDEN